MAIARGGVNAPNLTSSIPRNSTKRIAPVAKNDHKLKALAIKKSQIHVVGTPSLKFEGVPIFLDVEGMPDRDFYYLVGLRFECNGEQVERSFWADGLDGERAMWENSLRTLKAIGNAQIVSYGAYETRFLRQMKERYMFWRLTTWNSSIGSSKRRSTSWAAFTARSISRRFRIASRKLADTSVSSGRGHGLRRCGAISEAGLELGLDDGLKRELIAYNMDDCRAAATVADAIMRICGDGASGSRGRMSVRLEVGFQRTYGKFDCALPEFEKINSAAYWDYQRDRIYIRSNPYLRRATKRNVGTAVVLSVLTRLFFHLAPVNAQHVIQNVYS